MKIRWIAFLRVLALAAIICQAGVVGTIAQSPQLPATSPKVESPQWVAQPGEMPVDYLQVRTFGEVDVPYLTDVYHINSIRALITDPGYIPENLDQIYVVENQGQRMLGYEPDGANFLELGTAGLYGYFNDPVDAAVDPNGNLWVLTTGLIWVFDPVGNFLFKIPDNYSELPGNDPLRFNWAGGMDFIHNGPGNDYVLITEARQQSVKYFSVDLTTTPYTLEIIDTISGDFGSPIQVEAANDKFYVADDSPIRVIWECALASPYTCSVFDGGAMGNGDHDLMSANGLAADATYLYVVDQDNHRVKRCSLADGACEGNFIDSSDSSLINKPADVAVNSDGTLLVGNLNSMTVLKFNADGTLFTPTMQIGTPYVPYFLDEIHYYGPAGVEVDAQGNAYIIERQGMRIIKVNELGEQQWAFGEAGVEAGDTAHLGWPEGSPAIDSQGRVYLTSHNSRVVVLNPNGAYLTMIYSNEPDPGALSFACSVAIDAQDDIYVSDCNKNVVKVFGPNFVYKYTIGSTSASSPPPLDDDHFWAPRGIAFVDINTFYLADSSNSRIERCTRPDNTSETWSCKTFVSETRQGNWPPFTPVDVNVDAAGHVYVMDVSRAGFYVFTPEGEPFGQIGFGLSSDVDTMSYPSGLTVDAQGSIYVADRHNSVVRKYVPVIGSTEYLSQAGGGVTAVAKQGNYAVAADGAFLHVMDLTTSPPTEVGRSDLLNDTVLDIVISSGYAYAASELGWITIYDLSNIAHPAFVYRFPTNGSPATDIDVWGSKLYAAAGRQGLLVYDLADPKYPIQVGQMKVHQEVTGVALTSTTAGLTAFVTTRDAGTDGWLCALDVDVPANITLLDELDTPGRAENLAVQGDTVIVADGSDGSTAYGLRMINTVDPTNLIEVGNLEGYDSWRVEISGNYAYFLDGSQNMHSANISTPSAPTLADTIASNADMRALLPAGSSLLIADRANGLRLINISDPTHMSELPGWFNAPGQSEMAELKNGFIYQAAGNKGLQIINARDPLNPTVIGQLDLSGNTSFVKVDSGYAYTASQWGGMHIINVANPANPQRVGGYEAFYAEHLDVYKQTAYVVGWNALHILDVSDPTDVHEIGVFSDTERSIRFVKVEENDSGHIMAYILASDYSNQDSIQVLDVTDPSNIIAYDWYGTKFAEGFDVSDGIVYIPGNVFWGIFIFILDANNPSNIVDIGGYRQTAMNVSNVQVTAMDGRLYAYITTYQNGLLVADVTDPANTFLVGQIDLPGNARGVSVDGNLAAVSAGEAGTFLTWFAPQTNAVVGNNDLLTTQFDHVTYTFASDSLEDQMRIIHTPVYEGNTFAAPSGLQGIDHAFIVNALDFANDDTAAPINPYTLEIPYDQTDLGRILESTLKLYYWNGVAWVEEPSTLNQNMNTLTAYPNHFSTWRVLGVPYNWIYLPTVIR